MLVTQEQRRFTRMMHLKSPMIKSGDAIRILKISRQRLDSYRKKQMVECIRVGGQWRYLLHSLQWLKRNYLSLNLNLKQKRIIKANTSSYIIYKDKINKIKNLPLERKLNLNSQSLPLSERLKRVFVYDNLPTLKDIVTKTEAEHLRTPNLGRKSVNELKEFLNVIDLQLGMDFKDYFINKGIQNIYEIRITKVKGLYEATTIYVLANNIIDLYKILSPIEKQNNIECDVTCLGRAVNINETATCINDWLGNI